VSGVGPIRFRGRSFIAFALAPEPPIVEWLAQLDDWTRNSPGFFVGRPVTLDLTSIELSRSDIEHLVSELQIRDIRFMGIEGAAPDKLGPEMPPTLKGGRPAAMDGARSCTRCAQLGSITAGNNLVADGGAAAFRPINSLPKR